MATKNKFSPSPRHPRKTRVPVHGLGPCISAILAKYGEVGAASAVLGREVAQVVAIRRAEDLGLAEGCLPSSLEPPQTLSLRFARLVATCDFGLRAFAMLLVLSRLGQRFDKDCSEMR